MSPEDEAELKSNIRILVDLVREQSADLRDQGAKISALAEDVAYIKGRLAEQPRAAEVYELRGRVEEISRRLPTTLVYAPPARKEPAE